MCHNRKYSNFLNEADIININSSSFMQVLDMIPEFEIVSATSKIYYISSSGIDINLPGNINCKYYTHEEFSKLPNKNNSINRFHANVNGLENHFSDLELIISDANLKFNAICISKTSQKDTAMFKRNTNLDNFHPIFSTGTKTAPGGTVIYIRYTARGGTSIYVRNTHNTMERIDLNSCNLEFKST